MKRETSEASTRCVQTPESGMSSSSPIHLSIAHMGHDAWSTLYCLERSLEYESEYRIYIYMYAWDTTPVKHSLFKSPKKG